jgi:ABC-type sugar transport system substrate-binding protein
MNQEEAITLIRKLLMADSQESLQNLIAVNLSRMDNTFFAVLSEAAEAEAARNPALAARLASLAQILLPLRTLI